MYAHISRNTMRQQYKEAYRHVRILHKWYASRAPFFSKPMIAPWVSLNAESAAQTSFTTRRLAQ